MTTSDSTATTSARAPQPAAPPSGRSARTPNRPRVSARFWSPSHRHVAELDMGLRNVTSSWVGRGPGDMPGRTRLPPVGELIGVLSSQVEGHIQGKEPKFVTRRYGEDCIVYASLAAACLSTRGVRRLVPNARRLAARRPAFLGGVPADGQPRSRLGPVRETARPLRRSIPTPQVSRSDPLRGSQPVRPGPTAGPPASLVAPFAPTAGPPVSGVRCGPSLHGASPTR